MKNLIILAIIGSLFNQSKAQCQFEQSTFEDIAMKYGKEFKKLERESAEIGEEAPDPNDAEAMLNATFEVTMKRQDFGFDLISVTMRDKEISFNVPQVTMKMKSMKFKKPVTKMVIKKTGQYPQIHGWKIKWKDILTSVPVVTMEEEEIKTKIPEILFAKTSLITAIPEFKMTRQDVALDIPSITVKKISAEVKKIEEKAEAINNDSGKIKERQKEEIAIALHNSFDCQRHDLSIVRSNLSAEFNSAITEIDNNIITMKNYGLSPESIHTDTGEKINLLQMRVELLQKQDEAFVQIDNAIEKLNEDEKETLEKFIKE